MATYQEQLAKLAATREAKRKAAADRLTPDQIAHWRFVLNQMQIPFAYSMSVEMVQQFKNAVQARINALTPNSTKEEGRE